jgi:hypothetical protein
MKMASKREPNDDDLTRAETALQGWYEEGEDAYPVRLALESVASQLSEKAGVDPNSLDVVLEELLGADDSLVGQVRELYEAAEGGEYGEGMSPEQARRLNRLVDELQEPLIKMARDFQPSKSTPKGRPLPKSKGPGK